MWHGLSIASRLHHVSKSFLCKVGVRVPGNLDKSVQVVCIIGSRLDYCQTCKQTNKHIPHEMEPYSNQLDQNLGSSSKTLHVSHTLRISSCTRCLFVSRVEPLGLSFRVQRSLYKTSKFGLRCNTAGSTGGSILVFLVQPPERLDACS